MADLASLIPRKMPVQCLSRPAPFAQFPHSHTTRERHPGPIREKWAVRPDAQDELPHFEQRPLGIESATRSLVLCDSLKKAFLNSYSQKELRHSSYQKFPTWGNSVSQLF